MSVRAWGDSTEHKVLPEWAPVKPVIKGHGPVFVFTRNQSCFLGKQVTKAQFIIQVPTGSEEPPSTFQAKQPSYMHSGAAVPRFE